MFSFNLPCLQSKVWDHEHKGLRNPGRKEISSKNYYLQKSCPFNSQFNFWDLTQDFQLGVLQSSPTHFIFFFSFFFPPSLFFLHPCRPFFSEDKINHKCQDFINIDGCSGKVEAIRAWLADREYCHYIPGNALFLQGVEVPACVLLSELHPQPGLGLTRDHRDVGKKKYSHYLGK